MTISQFSLHVLFGLCIERLIIPLRAFIFAFRACYLLLVIVSYQTNIIYFIYLFIPSRVWRSILKMDTQFSCFWMFPAPSEYFNVGLLVQRPRGQHHQPFNHGDLRRTKSSAWFYSCCRSVVEPVWQTRVLVRSYRSYCDISQRNVFIL